MKTGPFARLSPEPPAKRRELRIRIAAALRYAEGKRDESQAAKVDFKRARKVFKRAKKIAKAARKTVKSLKRALAAVPVAAPAAKRPKSAPIRLIRPAKPAPKKTAPRPAVKKSPGVTPARKARVAAPRKTPAKPAPVAPRFDEDESAAAHGAPIPPETSLPVSPGSAAPLPPGENQSV
jgi:hypothetical protein